MIAPRNVLAANWVAAVQSSECIDPNEGDKPEFGKLLGRGHVNEVNVSVH